MVSVCASMCCNLAQFIPYPIWLSCTHGCCILAQPDLHPDLMHVHVYGDICLEQPGQPTDLVLMHTSGSESQKESAHSFPF